MRSDWFVIGFTRRAKHPTRAEIIMRACDRLHAHRLAAYFADDHASAIVLSGDCSSPRDQRVGMRLEAKFGNVPDNPLEWGLGGFVMAPPSSPVIGGQLTRLHPGGAVASRTPDRLRLTRMGLYRTATFIAVAMVALATSVTAIRANVDRRHTRLIEMARPHCRHVAASARDLHRLVHHALVHSDSKHDAFFTVVAQCQRANLAKATRPSQPHHNSSSCAIG